MDHQKIKTTFIRCNHCGERQRSPTQYEDTAKFNNSLNAANAMQCRKCGKMIPCNRATMSYELA